MPGLSREPVEATKRAKMTPARRAVVLERYGHRCAEPGCGVSFAADQAKAEIDHIIPLELSGADDVDNLQPLCRVHHAIKTAWDAKAIAKARRLRKREAGETRAKRPITARGFDKRLTKHMDGRVTRREATS